MTRSLTLANRAVGRQGIHWAAVMEKDLKRERKSNAPAKEKPKGLQAPIFAEDEGGNRFMKRQAPKGKEARKERKKKRKSPNRPGNR